MDRILIATQGDIQVTFYDSTGTATDATGTPTVTITREDGTILVTAQPTTHGGTGVYKYTLTPANTAALDIFKAVWTAVVGGTTQTFTTYAEIVGGFVFSIADARALKPLDSVTKYPSTAIVAARNLAEAALEDACGVAFVPRYFRDSFDGNATTDLLLDRYPRTLTIDSATFTGVTATLTNLALYPTGIAYLPGLWPLGRRNIVLKGTCGYLQAPARVSRACLLLAKRFLVDSPINDRTTQLNNEDGTSQFFVTAGVRAAIFDIPECNAVVQEYAVDRFHIA